MAITNELTNSPRRTRAIDASTTPGALPKTVSQAAWFFHVGSGGSWSDDPAQDRREDQIAPNPAQTTFRDRA